jgi:hypothetical protein
MRAILFSLSLLATAAHAADPALAGQYSLQGATEMGSQLHLTKDGKFEWALSYGNQDFASMGKWEVRNKRVVLTATQEALDFRPMKEDELNLKKKPKPGVWVAIVGIPDYGPVADVEVRFEAKSGRSAVAKSMQNGDAIVDMPAGETWVRAGLRAEGAAYDYQWIDIPADRASARIAGFALKNVSALQSGGFKTMELKQENGGLVVVGKPALGGRYVKMN